MLCCTAFKETSNVNAAKECMLKLMPLAEKLICIFKVTFLSKKITADMNELARGKCNSEKQLFFFSNSDCTHLDKNPSVYSFK